MDLVLHRHLQDSSHDLAQILLGHLVIQQVDLAHSPMHLANSEIFLIDLVKNLLQLLPMRSVGLQLWLIIPEPISNISLSDDDSYKHIF